MQLSRRAVSEADWGIAAQTTGISNVGDSTNPKPHRLPLSICKKPAAKRLRALNISAFVIRLVLVVRVER